MGRVSAAGMREHVRERNQMDGGNRTIPQDEGCSRRHDRLETRYCPECGADQGWKVRS